jgi:aryl-alcohol dehydrogenase-like predicted oxidoreductase
MEGHANQNSSQLFTERRSEAHAPDPGVTRREFLGVSAAGALFAGITPLAAGADAKGDILYRTLGRTGEKVSAIGLGGWHVGWSGISDDLATRLVRTALDGGINFLDNCWDYNAGNSEVRMGKALRDGYREKAFLMTKIDAHTKTAAAQQIDESLRRLQTDHLDLLQFHEVIRMTDPSEIFAPEGGMEAALAAKKAGKIRYIGFTGHKNPDMHLNMLKTADAHSFHFDSVQMPLNAMDAHYESFEKKVLPVLVEKQIGVLGMKPIGNGGLLRSNTVTAIECLHYALNLPTSVVITGCQSMDDLNQALQVARTFRPMDEKQVAALLAKTADAAQNGQFEGYKTTTSFDGTFQNPHWLTTGSLSGH